MGDLMTEFIGIRAKSYCFKTENRTIKKIKGVRKIVVSDTINMTDFKNFIFDNIELYCTMNTFRSVNHTMYTQKLNKICLYGNDDKRFQIRNSFKTLPGPTC